MTREVLVVGGGVIGLASAWELARRGRSVTVVDPDPGRGTSHVAAGMLAPVTEVTYGERDLLALNIAAARRWPRFAAALGDATGRDVGYRTTGTLQVGFDRDDAAVLRDLHAFQRELGLEVTPLHGDELRAREPMLSPRVQVGLLAGDDHRVEPRAVVAALLRACGDAGVELHRATVRRLDHDGDRVTGVTTTDGDRLQADRVVLAAGVWSPTIEGLPAAAVPPVRPVKGQLLHLRDPGGRQVLGTTVRGFVRHRGIYLVPREDGRLVVGASQEERGFDVTVTAGVTRQLLEDAATLVPGIDELELTETVAGLRPTTPDNAPVIGAGGLDGLVLATGHHRHGVLLAPITAEAVADLVEGTEPDPTLVAAAPDRPAVAPRPDTARTRPAPGMASLVAANRERGGRP